MSATVFDRVLAGTLMLAASCIASANGPAAGETVSHGRFDNVRLFRPASVPNGVTLLLSGDKGWTPAEQAMADALTAKGAFVAGIDTASLARRIEADEGRCVFPDGDLENLSRFVQAYAKLPGYAEPVIVAQPGKAAGLGYALAVQAEPGLFPGVVSLGFCPELALRKPLCESEKGPGVPATRKAGGLDFKAAPVQSPWIATVADGTAACAPTAVRDFVGQVKGGEVVASDTAGAAAQVVSFYTRLNANRKPAPPPPPASVADLPIVPSPAPSNGDTFVILLSGDGGWAGIDKELAAAMVADGVPVLGFDSLRYFWTKRTPESSAADLDRLIRFYLTNWKKRKVVLMGFSQGADVLPFIVNRLPEETRRHVSLAAFLSPGQKADFEFKLTNWVASSRSGLPIRPEMEKLPAGLGMCVYGKEDDNSVCPALAKTLMLQARFPGGHHFDGDNAKVARTVLNAAASCDGPRVTFCGK